MNKTCLAFIGVLLLALHLSAQVIRSEANNTNLANSTMTPPVDLTTKDKNGCERTAGFPLLLLPLALAASVLHGWSQ